MITITLLCDIDVSHCSVCGQVTHLLQSTDIRFHNDGLCGALFNVSSQTRTIVPVPFAIIRAESENMELSISRIIPPPYEDLDIEAPVLGVVETFCVIRQHHDSTSTLR